MERKTKMIIGVLLAVTLVPTIIIMVAYSQYEAELTVFMSHYSMLIRLING